MIAARKTDAGAKRPATAHRNTTLIDTVPNRYLVPIRRPLASESIAPKPLAESRGVAVPEIPATGVEQVVPDSSAFTQLSKSPRAFFPGQQSLNKRDRAQQ
jgi:hypothetical protein